MQCRADLVKTSNLSQDGSDFKPVIETCCRTACDRCSPDAVDMASALRSG